MIIMMLVLIFKMTGLERKIMLRKSNNNDDGDDKWAKVVILITLMVMVKLL